MKKERCHKHIHKPENILAEGTVAFQKNKFILNGTALNKKNIRAVFMYRDYLLFVLKNKKCFLIQADEQDKTDLLRWVKKVSVYSWDKKNLKTARKSKDVSYKVSVIALIAVVVLSFAERTLIVVPVVDPVEKFTFDMSADIPSQIHHIYEYYESDCDFSGCVDIYYSYASQKANLMAKTNYKKGDIKKEKELLFTEGDNFYYVKLFKPENEENLVVEITDISNTYLLQKTEDGYTISSEENNTILSPKDAYMHITGADYIIDNYTHHYSAYYHFKKGTVIVQGTSKAKKGEFTMAVEGISFKTDEDEEYKVALKTISENDATQLKNTLESAIKDGSIRYATLLKEINRLCAQ